MSAPFPRQNASRVAKRRPPIVTIVIGFVSDNAIVLASDSQISYSDTAKIHGVTKIEPVTFQNKQQVLVAKAGTMDTANAFIEYFSAKAAGLTITSSRTVPDLAEQAIREVRTKIFDQFRDPALTSDDYLRHWDDYSCEFLIAFYALGQPYIVTIKSYHCLATLTRTPFTAIGCASNLASFVLYGFDFNRMDFSQSLGLAVYTVQMCKEHDSGCGGHVQVGIISSINGQCTIFPRDIIHRYEQACVLAAPQIKDAMVEKVNESFNKIGAALKNPNLPLI